MWKNIIAGIFILSLFLSACGEEGRQSRPSASSSGQPYELMVVYNGDTTVQNAIRRALAGPFPALPQPESWFDIRFVEVDNLSNMHKRQRNIVFAGSVEEDDELARIIKELFGEETVTETIENPNRFYSSSRDVWAKPQIVIALYDETTDKLVQNISDHQDFLTEQLDRAETRRLRNEITGAPRNARMVNRLRNNHNLTLHLPKIFETIEEHRPEDKPVLEELGLDKLAWLRGQTRQTNQEIIIYYQDYVDEDQIQKENLLQLRDSVGKHFIPGPSEGSFMQTEHRYMFRQKEVDIGGMYGIETRGLWRVENDFMGGPFINYAVWDEANNRILHLDGMIYAPEKSKRDLIKRMEVILNTLSIPDEDA